MHPKSYAHTQQCEVQDAPLEGFAANWQFSIASLFTCCVTQPVTMEMGTVSLCSHALVDTLQQTAAEGDIVALDI